MSELSAEARYQETRIASEGSSAVLTFSRAILRSRYLAVLVIGVDTESRERIETALGAFVDQRIDKWAETLVEPIDVTLLVARAIAKQEGVTDYLVATTDLRDRSCAYTQRGEVLLLLRDRSGTRVLPPPEPTSEGGIHAARVAFQKKVLLGLLWQTPPGTPEITGEIISQYSAFANQPAREALREALGAEGVALLCQEQIEPIAEPPSLEPDIKAIVKSTVSDALANHPLLSTNQEPRPFEADLIRKLSQMDETVAGVEQHLENRVMERVKGELSEWSRHQSQHAERLQERMHDLNLAQDKLASREGVREELDNLRERIDDFSSDMEQTVSRLVGDLDAQLKRQVNENIQAMRKIIDAPLGETREQLGLIKKRIGEIESEMVRSREIEAVNQRMDDLELRVRRVADLAIAMDRKIGRGRFFGCLLHVIWAGLLAALYFWYVGELGG